MAREPRGATRPGNSWPVLGHPLRQHAGRAAGLDEVLARAGLAGLPVASLAALMEAVAVRTADAVIRQRRAAAWVSGIRAASDLEDDPWDSLWRLARSIDHWAPGARIATITDRARDLGIDPLVALQRVLNE